MRPEVKQGRFPWYALSRYAADYVQEFTKDKIVYQAMQVKPCFAIDKTGSYCNNSIWFFPEGSKYLVGVLNSNVGWFLISNYCTKIQNGYQLIYKYLENIPIVETRNKEESKIKDDIEKNVDLILTLTEQIKSEKIIANINAIEQKINHCEEKINTLVYSLYQLSEAKISIIEQSSND